MASNYILNTYLIRHIHTAEKGREACSKGLHTDIAAENTDSY